MGKLGFPFMQVVLDSVGSYAGASVIISIVIAMSIFAVTAFLATASRIVFAFGRDKGLPFWQTMAKVGRSQIKLLPDVLALRSSSLISFNLGHVCLTFFLLGGLQDRNSKLRDLCFSWCCLFRWHYQPRLHHCFQYHPLYWDFFPLLLLHYHRGPSPLAAYTR